MRVSSFSRTSDEYIPGSEETSSTSTAGESGDEEVDPEVEADERGEKRWSSDSQTKQKSDVRPSIKTSSKDGPSTLRELVNVKDIICVAFGAFDRYFISWEDTEGEFHQGKTFPILTPSPQHRLPCCMIWRIDMIPNLESNKLPSGLYQWLFSADGTQHTRDIPTLQVSFGSNDEFFASDKNGKISYRDSILPPPPPQPKAQPLSEKKVPPSIATVARGLGFMRRKAYTVSSPSPTVPKAIDKESRMVRVERRKTYMDGQSSSASRSKNAELSEPIREPGESAQRLKSWAPKHERRRSIFAVSEGQLKRLSRRSTLIEGISETTLVETATQPVDHEGDSTIENERLTSRSPKGKSSSDGLLPSAPEARQDLRKQDKRRSLLVNTLPVRVSWPESKTILQARERIDRTEVVEMRDCEPPAAEILSYASAEIQRTAGLGPLEKPEFLSPLQYDFSPEQHISIGVMSEFFRCQYRLGDALAFV